MIQDNQGRSIVEYLKLDVVIGFSHKCLNLVYTLAGFPECLLVDNALDSLPKKLEEKINASSNMASNSHNAQDVRQE
jgi:hypothetical protein